MYVRRFSTRVLATAMLCSFAGIASAYDTTGTFNASAEVNAAVTVDCTTDLRFGNIVYRAANTAAVVTVAATAGGAISSNDASVIPISGSGSAACTVANEAGEGVSGDATAALSAAGATWTTPTLADVVLTDSGVNTLSADLTLSKTTAIGNETIYVGGALSIPTALAFPGVYTSGVVTLTITD
jgi:hypothetical protein